MSSMKVNKPCGLLEQYLAYLTAIRCRLNLAFEYRIDYLLLYEFIRQKHGMPKQSDYLLIICVATIVS